MTGALMEQDKDQNGRTQPADFDALVAEAIADPRKVAGYTGFTLEEQEAITRMQFIPDEDRDAS